MKLLLACTAAFALVSIPSSGDGQKPPAKLAPELDAEDVADIPSQDLRLDGDDKRRYLLAGPRPNEKEPKAGFGLIVVLPGGTGEAGFHPFVKRLYKHSVPDGFLVVQPVAPKWMENQPITWPTDKGKSQVNGMKFSCDDFVEQVIAELAKARKIDPARVYTLSWSSSGPLAYLLSSRKGGAVRGSFVAMSVFRDRDVDLKQVKGKPYYVYHSKDDKTCAFRMAEEARDALKKNGAIVEFKTYEGGHGWHGDMYGDLRTGFEWLVKQK